MGTTDLLKAFGAFFAVMNPFVNLPIFLAMTTDFTLAEQRVLAVKVALFSAIMSAVILLAGSQIIGFFGITIDQFRIAGGIVLGHIAWSMLNGTEASSHHGTEKERGRMADLTGLAFYPLAFPMIIGPGTITTLILYAGRAKGIGDVLGVAAIVAVILLMLLTVFCFAGFFGRVLTETMRVITTRLMGMILLAIAVAMVVAGGKAVFPGLVS